MNGAAGPITCHATVVRGETSVTPAKRTPPREVFWIRVRILILFRAPQRYGNDTRLDEIKSPEEILELCRITER